MQDIIEIIGEYAIYVYPGIISLFITNFMLARSTKFDNNKIIYIILFGYLYVFVYTWIMGIEVDRLTKTDNLIILIISLIMPIFINFMYKTFRTDLEPVLFKLKISTSLEDTVFDHLYGRKDEPIKKERNMYVRLYSAKLPFRYEGVVESYESDPDKEMVICLTRYKIKKKNGGEYSNYKDFSNRVDRYLYIRIKEIESMEIEYI